MSISDFTQQLWVPWIDAYLLPKADARYEAPESGMEFSVRPDIPAGFGYYVIDAAYDDLVDSANKMATTHLLIGVTKAAEQAITNDVAYNSLPLKTRMIVEMHAACYQDWNGTAEAYFATIPGLSLSSGATKTAAKECLEQAKARGLSDAKAEAIRADYSLPSLASVSP